MPTRAWGKLAVAGFMAVMLISGCTGEPVVQPDEPPPVTTEPAAQTEVTVYFSNDTADKLIPVKRSVPIDVTPMKAAIEALIAGPAPEERLLPVIPKGTKLKQLNVTEGNAHINLSSEFRENHTGGSAGELLTLYALANTLTDFPQVKTVRIWVEDKQLQEFIHMDLRQGLQRRTDLIQAKP